MSMFRDKYGNDRLSVWAAMFVGVMVVLVAVIAVVTIATARHFNRVNCDSFARNTGRETKFVLYNWASAGDCLTPTADGRWISTVALREFGSKP